MPKAVINIYQGMDFFIMAHKLLSEDEISYRGTYCRSSQCLLQCDYELIIIGALANFIISLVGRQNRPLYNLRYHIW
jgi:hypothetical protein